VEINSFLAYKFTDNFQSFILEIREYEKPMDFLEMFLKGYLRHMGDRLKIKP
jgi:hypothetical protein